MATIDFDPKDRHGNPLGEIKHEEYNLEESRQVKYIAGLEEGDRKRQLAIAKTMLKKGLEYGFIQEMTGVS